MIIFFLVVILLIHGNVFSSEDSEDRALAEGDRILSNYRSSLELAKTSEALKNELNRINQHTAPNALSVDLIKSLSRDFILFALVKKFPVAFNSIFYAARKPFALEDILETDGTELPVIKNVKAYPNGWLIVKLEGQVLSDDNEECPCDFFGAKRLSEIPSMVLYNPTDQAIILVNKYRKNWNNSLMWFQGTWNDILEEENKFYVADLIDGIIDDSKFIESVPINVVEDIIDEEGLVCTFENGILSFLHNNDVLKVFSVLQCADGRFVKRMKNNDKMKYLFVQGGGDQSQTFLLLFNNPVILMSAPTDVEVSESGNIEQFFQFFQNFGIKDIKKNKEMSEFWIQSMIGSHHRFGITFKKDDDFFSKVVVDTYFGIDGTPFTEFPKQYPFSNYLQIESHESMIELRYGDETVPFPLEGVTELSSAKCNPDEDDRTGGTNLVFKQDTHYYTLSTESLFDALAENH